MEKIFRLLTAWLSRLGDPPYAADPLATLSAREWADLPAHHPLRDPGCGCEA